MSEIVKCVGGIKITDLNTLKRALQLCAGNKLKLDESIKSFRYYRGGEKPCDAAIVYAKNLTEQEKFYMHEIGLRLKDGEYEIWADFWGQQDSLTPLVGHDCITLGYCYQAVQHIDIASEQNGQVSSIVFNRSTGEMELELEVA